MTYVPDNWVIIKLNSDDPHYRVLAGWSGGYTQGNSWRMNSGIIKVEETNQSFKFYGSSGSCYVCNKQSYGLRMNNAGVWNELSKRHGDKIELLPEETDWTNIDWIIK